MLLISQLTSCSSTIKVEWPEGGGATVNLAGDYNLVRQESYNGRGGLLGMFGAGRSGDGSLSRAREYQVAQATGEPFSLVITREGVTMGAATIDHSGHTGRIQAGIHDSLTDLAAARVAGSMVSEGADIIKEGIDAASQ